MKLRKTETVYRYKSTQYRYKENAQTAYRYKTGGRRIFSFAPVIYLLIAVILTTGTTFSRYSTTICSSSDSARVAKFVIEMGPTDSKKLNFNGANAQPKENISDTSDVFDVIEKTYEFTVTSKSEVSVKYYIQVEFPVPPPTDYLTLQIVNTKYSTDVKEPEWSSDRKTATFTASKDTTSDKDDFKFAPAPSEGITKNYKLILTFDPDKSINKDDFNSEPVIKVVAEQID